jgi:hypothetical protein
MENSMDMECGTHENEEGRIRVFGRKARRKETTRKIKT